MELATLYEKHNYPSTLKFYKILKKIDPEVKFADIDNFVKLQKSYQLHKKPRTSIEGHIIAYSENALWFMDLLDMSNYSRHNKGYKWILIAIDTFTRKAYAVALKQKTKFEVKRGFEEIYIRASEASDHSGSIKLIITDSGKEVLNKTVQELFDDLKIKHGTVDIGDHHALGLIDRFSRTIKEIIFKSFTESETVVWFDKLNNFISAYNSSPHSGILNYSPDEVSGSSARSSAVREEAENKLIDLNIEKSMPVEHKFNLNDLVRKKLARPTFRKGYKQIWSDRTYNIKNISGVHCNLNNDEKVRLDSLQKVVEIEKVADIVADADKEIKIENTLKHEGIDKENIIESRLRNN